jgi:hypothetical protein
MTQKITPEICETAWSSIVQGVIQHLRDAGSGKPNGCIVVVDLTILPGNSPRENFQDAILHISAIERKGKYRSLAVTDAYNYWIEEKVRTDAVVVFVGTVPRTDKIFEEWMVGRIRSLIS